MGVACCWRCLPRPWSIESRRSVNDADVVGIIALATVILRIGAACIGATCIETAYIGATTTKPVIRSIFMLEQAVVSIHSYPVGACFNGLVDATHAEGYSLRRSRELKTQ